MKIIVLNENLETIGAIPLFSTLIWTRRYYEYGLYELHASAKYFPLLKAGAYIYRNDREELGMIEDIEYAQDEKGNRTCFAKGYFSEKLLERKVIPESITVSGTPEAIGRQLVTTYAIEAEEPLLGVVLGEESGIGTSIKLQDTGVNLSEKLYEMEKTQEQSHRLRYDYLTNSLSFEVWQGKDRTQSQTENSWAVFSNSFANVKNIVYEKDVTEYKNYAYVAGEATDTGRTIVIVDIRESEDEPRREIYVDARDLQSEDSNGSTMSADEYEQLLYQRGLEKLMEYQKVEVVNSGIDPLANLEYLVDFDLGDMSTYINTEVGIELDQRITEIQEVHEKGTMAITVVFGQDEATSVKKIIKREAS